MTAKQTRRLSRCSRRSIKPSIELPPTVLLSVLTGRQGIFSGGFDLKVLGAGGPDAAAMLEQGFLLALRLLEHPAPVIIACNGHAVAMGIFLLLSGDYRIGVNGPFRLVANEVAIGLTMPQTAIEICRQRLAPSHFNRAIILAETYARLTRSRPGFWTGWWTDRSDRRLPGRWRRNSPNWTVRLTWRPSPGGGRQTSMAAIRKGLEIDQNSLGASMRYQQGTNSRRSRLLAPGSHDHGHGGMDLIVKWALGLWVGTVGFEPTLETV